MLRFFGNVCVWRNAYGALGITSLTAELNSAEMEIEREERSAQFLRDNPNPDYEGEWNVEFFLRAAERGLDPITYWLMGGG